MPFFQVFKCAKLSPTKGPLHLLLPPPGTLHTHASILLLDRSSSSSRFQRPALTPHLGQCPRCLLSENSTLSWKDSIPLAITVHTHVHEEGVCQAVGLTGRQMQLFRQGAHLNLCTRLHLHKHWSPAASQEGGRGSDRGKGCSCVPDSSVPQRLAQIL